MPRYICHHEGKFFEWSTVVDAPVTHAMTRDEFEEHYRFQYGQTAMNELPDRLDRAVAHGCSARPEPMTLRALFALNRAGDDETEATFEEIIAAVSAPAEPEPRQ